MEQDRYHYTTIEQHRIMHDLEASKRVAIEQGDRLKTYYLNEINVNN